MQALAKRKENLKSLKIQITYDKIFTLIAFIQESPWKSKINKINSIPPNNATFTSYMNYGTRLAFNKNNSHF